MKFVFVREADNNMLTPLDVASAGMTNIGQQVSNYFEYKEKEKYLKEVRA